MIKSYQAVGALAVVLLASSAGVGAASAQAANSALSRTIQFNIPAQPLASALNEFGRQSGLQVSLAAATSRGVTAQPVVGNFTGQAALGRLLAGSGIRYEVTPDGTVVLSRNGDDANAQGATGSIQLDTVEVHGDGGSNPNSPIQADGYVATSSVAATKTNTPLIEVPQSVSTITRQELNDRNDQTLTAAVLYTPGVRANTSGFDPRFDSFFIRGLNTTYDGVFRDGLREQNAPFAIFKAEPYGLDGITILKGPSSSLYGGGSPAGIIDLTTKRPNFTPFGEVQAQIGTDNRRQGQFDIGGPVDVSAGALAYRFTGLWRESDTNVPGTPDDKIYIAPAVTWKPNPDTVITFLSEYSKIKTGANLAYYNRPRRPIVTDIFSGDPSFNALNQEQARVGYEFEHNVTDNVTVRQKFRYAHIDVDGEYVDILPFKSGDKFANRGAGSVTDRVDSLNLDNQIELKGSTGPIAHTLLAGVEALYVDYTDEYGYTENPNRVSPIKLDPLTYGGYISAPKHNYGNANQKQTNIGLYAQDQMKVGQFVATIGVRKDWVNTQTENYLTNTEAENDNAAFTGRGGLMYLGPMGINPYVTFATSFTPVLGSDLNGKVFVPMTGELHEVGIKFAPPDYNVVVTASVFDITEQNVTRTDPNNLNRSIQTGELRSRGFELEVTGSLSNGLSFTGGYTYLEPKIVKGEPGTDGNQISAIPQHAAALWADYVFQPGSALAGLSIGGGARYTGETYGNDENTFKNKAYLLFDASLKFDFERIDPSLKGVALQVNARNLGDVDIRTCEQGYCYRDEGRQVIGSLQYRW